jgi:hypothetical protein
MLETAERVAWLVFATASIALYCYIMIQIAREKRAVAERIGWVFAALVAVCLVGVIAAFELFGALVGAGAIVLGGAAVFWFIAYCVRDVDTYGRARSAQVFDESETSDQRDSRRPRGHSASSGTADIPKSPPATT